MEINDSMMSRMKFYLDLSAKKQMVITSNLANADTPHYKANSFDFETVFREEVGQMGSLKATRPEHFSKPRLIRDPAPTQRPNSRDIGPDGNNVDMEKEMSALAENVIKFRAVSQLYSQRIRTIQFSIREGQA